MACCEKCGGPLLLTEDQRVDVGPQVGPGTLIPVRPGTARAARLGRKEALEKLERRRAAGLVSDRPPSVAELVRLWAEDQRRGRELEAATATAAE